MSPDSPKKRASHSRPDRPEPKYGKGTDTQGRLVKDLPEDTDRIVGNRSPPYDVVGVDALSPLLEHVEFPATKQQIVDRIGDYHIPIDARTTSPVSSIMDQVVPNEFRSGDEVAMAVSRMWDEIAMRGESRGGRHAQRDYVGERPRED